MAVAITVTKEKIFHLLYEKSDTLHMFAGVPKIRYLPSNLTWYLNFLVKSELSY